MSNYDVGYDRGRQGKDFGSIGDELRSRESVSEKRRGFEAGARDRKWDEYHRAKSSSSASSDSEESFGYLVFIGFPVISVFLCLVLCVAWFIFLALMDDKPQSGRLGEGCGHIFSFGFVAIYLLMFVTSAYGRIKRR